MKIRVFKVNEFSVKFDMITDDELPKAGDYHLVPVGSENLFVHEFVDHRYKELLRIEKNINELFRLKDTYEATVQNFIFKIKQLEQSIELLRGKYESEKK